GDLECFGIDIYFLSVISHRKGTPSPVSGKVVLGVFEKEFPVLCGGTVVDNAVCGYREFFFTLKGFALFEISNRIISVNGYTIGKITVVFGFLGIKNARDRKDKQDGQGNIFHNRYFYPAKLDHPVTAKCQL